MSKWAYSTEGFERIVHRVEGVETVTYAIGQGEPLVYFHGGGTFHGFEWVARAGERVPRLLPLSTRTSAKAATRAFDEMGDYVSHYELLFPALGLDTFHLAGASMGGHMAARYAAANPGDIDKLVLVSPAGLKSERASMPDFTKVAPQDMPKMFVADPAWIEPYWPANPSPEWQALRDRESAGRVRLARGHRRPPTARCARGSRASTARRCCCGARTTGSSRSAMAQDWQEVLPHAELAVIPGGSHLLLDEFPAAVEALRTFLKA